MKKQRNCDDASTALDFVESLEQTKKHLELWCTQQFLRYTGESWPVGFAAKQMKSSLQAYVDAAVHRGTDTENYAWRLSMAKFAERLADRYGVELN